MLTPTVAFLDLGAPELIIILIIVLLFFGGKRLPQLSRSLGESMRELRKGISGKETKKEKNDKDKTSASQNGGQDNRAS